MCKGAGQEGRAADPEAVRTAATSPAPTPQRRKDEGPFSSEDRSVGHQQATGDGQQGLVPTATPSADPLRNAADDAIDPSTMAAPRRTPAAKARNPEPRDPLFGPHRQRVTGVEILKRGRARQPRPSMSHTPRGNGKEEASLSFDARVRQGQGTQAVLAYGYERPHPSPRTAIHAG